MSENRVPGREPWTDAQALVVLLILSAVIRVWMFRGLSGFDDSTYALRGLEVANGLWLQSDYIGALRYGMNLPIAAAVNLLGKSEGALAAWGLVCSLAEIAIVYAFAALTWGTRVAVIACMVLSTIPEHIDSATNICADAPFSALLTASIALLYFGANSRGPGLLIAAGLACGFAGWVKPEPAVLFSLVLGVLTLVYVHDRQRIVWLVLGVSIAALMNFALFTWAFDDPLYYLHAGYGNIKTNFVQREAPWGIHDANFYFRLMFFDGRAFWLAPFLAVLGAWFSFRERATIQRHAGRFTILWLILLLLFFSFFVYSLSPVRLIPKQTNYAVFFAAPIALLAGIALARMRTSAVIALFVLLGVGGLMLAALDSYRRDLHAATNRATIRFARTHDSAVVFATTQSLTLNNVLRLMGKENASNLRPLSGIDEAIRSNNALPDGAPIFAAYYPDWPEAKGKVAELFRGESTRCMQQIAEAVGEPGTTDRVVTRIIIAVRAILPTWADRHMRFTDKVLSPLPVRFYSVDGTCLAQATKRPRQGKGP